MDTENRNSLPTGNGSTSSGESVIPADSSFILPDASNLSDGIPEAKKTAAENSQIKPVNNVINQVNININNIIIENDGRTENRSDNPEEPPVDPIDLDYTPVNGNSGNKSKSADSAKKPAAPVEPPPDEDEPESKNKRFPFILVTAAVLLIVLIVSVAKLFTMFKEYRDARQQYSQLSDLYVDNAELPPPPSETPVSQPEQTQQDQDIEPAEEQPKVFSPISVDFNALSAICSDIEGWLYSPDTVINYPVVQCADNEKYLANYINGEYNGSGTLFIDYRCVPDFGGKISIIYGHHMKDGSMLASICNYKKQDYYDQHPVMYLNTPDGNYLIRVFSSFTTSADSSVYTFDFANDYDYSSYLIKMKSFSDFQCGVDPVSSDNIVVLSTCTYEYDSARYVLFGILEAIS